MPSTAAAICSDAMERMANEASHAKKAAFGASQPGCLICGFCYQIMLVVFLHL